MLWWRLLVVGLTVGVISGTGLSSSDANASTGTSAETEIRRNEPPLTVQIAGRFCRYQREDVKAALGEVWSVDAVEFLTDDGTVRVFFEPGRKSRADVADEVEHALSLGWLCTATVERGERDRAASMHLLQVRR